MDSNCCTAAPPAIDQQNEQTHFHLQQDNEHPIQEAAPQTRRTLWVGDLQYWMDEYYLSCCFPDTGALLSIKIIRDKQTGRSKRYGFLEFESHAAAQEALDSYNLVVHMHNTGRILRLDWARTKCSHLGNNYFIIVKDLARDVRGARIVIDRNTGLPKGYWFVRFGDESEQMCTMVEMNGVYCLSGSSYQNASDNNNTTVYVGDLDPSVTHKDLEELFAQFGEVTRVKKLVSKRCGFVQFRNRASAEEALEKLNGTVLAGQAIRLAWARRNPINRYQGDYYGEQDQNILPP